MEKKQKAIPIFIMLPTLIMIILIATHFSSICSAQAGVPPNAVELRTGKDMVGLSNVTLDGVINVPVGSLCEVRDSETNALLDSFRMGDGTEGPPGVFKPGQFYCLFTVGPNPYESASASIYIRVYDGPSVSESTKYGDSQILTVNGGNTYDIPGWSLSLPASNLPNTDDDEDDDNNSLIDDTDGAQPFWKNPLFISVIIAIIALVIITYLLQNSKPQKAAASSKPQRRRDSRKRK
jgi:hypothetical protein